MPEPPSAPCRVLLVGMMGSGKSTIGRLLAGATGWPYVDNDELLRRQTGATARELLASGGVARLRAAESEALALGLTLPSPVVVGVAAGTILDAADRARMRDGIVVWLRAAVEVLIGRAVDAEHRPFVERRAAAWLEDASRVRAPLYAEVADLVVDTGAATPDEAVGLIRAYLVRAATCPPTPRA